MTIQVDADVLLIDEVLAVGDAAFQQKCFDVFHRLRDEGKTMLFVTHDMGAVVRFCQRAMLLERGQQRLIGEPERVGAHYVELNFGRDRTAEGRAAEAGLSRGEAVVERFGSGGAEITYAGFENEHGVPTEHLTQGSRCTFRMRVRFDEPLGKPNMAVLLETEDHVPLFATSVYDCGVDPPEVETGWAYEFSVSFTMLFRPGRIYASPWLVRWGTADAIDRRPRMTSAVVTATHDFGALVNLPHTAEYGPAEPAVLEVHN